MPGSGVTRCASATASGSIAACVLNAAHNVRGPVGAFGSGGVSAYCRPGWCRWRSCRDLRRRRAVMQRAGSTHRQVSEAALDVLDRRGMVDVTVGRVMCDSSRDSGDMTGITVS